MSPFSTAIWEDRLLLNIPDSTNSGSSSTLPRHLFSLSQFPPKGFSYHFLQPSQRAQITFIERQEYGESDSRMPARPWWRMVCPCRAQESLVNFIWCGLLGKGGLCLVRGLNFNWHIVKGGLWQFENIVGLDFFFFWCKGEKGMLVRNAMG